MADIQGREGVKKGVKAVERFEDCKSSIAMKERRRGDRAESNE